MGAALEKGVVSPHRVLGVGGEGDRKDLGMLLGNVRVKEERRLGKKWVYLVISDGDSADDWANTSRNFQAQSTTLRLRAGSLHASALPRSVCFEVGIDCRTVLARSTTPRLRTGSHHASAVPWYVRFKIGIFCCTFLARSTTPRLRAGSHFASALPWSVCFEIGIDCCTLFIKTPFEVPKQENRIKYHEKTKSDGDAESEMVWEWLVSDIIRRNCQSASDDECHEKQTRDLGSMLEILVAVPAVLMAQLKVDHPAHGVAEKPPTEPAPPVSMSLHAVLGEPVLIYHK